MSASGPMLTFLLALPAYRPTRALLAGTIGLAAYLSAACWRYRPSGLIERGFSLIGRRAPKAREAKRRFFSPKNFTIRPWVLRKPSLSPMTTAERIGGISQGSSVKGRLESLEGGQASTEAF